MNSGLFFYLQCFFADTQNMDFLTEDFKQFIEPDCNRKEYLEFWLRSLGVPFNEIHMEGKTHIYVHFPSEAYNPQFRIKTVLVHYDRSEDTPGANDNSAAVYQVVKWAFRLMQRTRIHNVRIFFTDGEECGTSAQVENQGAFGIAQMYKRLGIVNDDVFVFDCCGRGDTLILSTAGKWSRCSDSFRKRFDDLYDRASDIARRASPSRWMQLPVPYSDNAGFLATGIPAVAITVLPAEEASLFVKTIQRDSSIAKKAMAKNREQFPLTWQYMHTKKDSAESLTSEAFAIMERYLDILADSLALN